jgi:hypothetical protein
VLTEENLDDISPGLGEVVTDFGSSVWIGKKYSSHWNKVADTQN